MIRVLIKPARRLFSRRQQWTFEIRGGNGDLVDPRETYYNRGDAITIMQKVFSFSEPAELVIYDRYGEVEERRPLR
jgi:hypothetical protein